MLCMIKYAMKENNYFSYFNTSRSASEWPFAGLNCVPRSASTVVHNISASSLCHLVGYNSNDFFLIYMINMMSMGRSHMYILHKLFANFWI